MGEAIKAIVSSNGRTGFCNKCGRENIALGDVFLPNGTIVHGINCPDCITNNTDIQSRILVSVGYYQNPQVDYGVQLVWG